MKPQEHMKRAHDLWRNAEWSAARGGTKAAAWCRDAAANHRACAVRELRDAATRCPIDEAAAWIRLFADKFAAEGPA